MLYWPFRSKDKPVRLTEFDHIVSFAEALAKSNPAALIDLSRILLRPLQAELLLTAIENEMHGARHEIEDYKFWVFVKAGGRQQWADVCHASQKS